MIVRVCPNCGKHNAEKGVNCIDCGTTLSIKTLMDTESGQFLHEKLAEQHEKLPVQQMTLKYAQLIVKDETPAKLILETNPLSRRKPSIGCFTTYILIAIITSSLTYMFINKNVGWVCFFLTVCLTIYLIYKSVKIYSNAANNTTTIIIDLDYGKVTRIKAIPGRPDEQAELSLNQVSKISLFSAYSHSHAAFKEAVVTLTKGDETEFVINSSRYDEMKLFAQKIAALINKPIEDKQMDKFEDLPI